MGIGVGAGLILLILYASLFSSGMPFGNKIAIINIRGVISSSPDLLTETFTLQEAFSLFKRVEDDQSIKGVLLIIDSPGGSVVASREIAYALREIKKPKVCWLGDIATSGAYWIASSCDRIVADPLTITGSIGVSASYLEFSKLFEKYGVTYEQITSGERKDMGSPFRNLTEEEREKLQYMTNEIFTYFLNDIKERRNLIKWQIDKISSGDIFLGKDAVSLGLVDSLGTLSDAKEIVKKLVGLNNIEFIEIEKKGISLFDLLRMG